MYCSNCGYKIDKKKIDKALEKDAKKVTDISYLAKSLLNIKKFNFKTKIKLAKEDLKIAEKDKQSLEEIQNLKEKLNEVKISAKAEYINEVKEIYDKLHNNDYEYFKNILHVSEKRTPTTKDYYVCPRCGKLIHPELNEDDIKSLARAAHSEIHRGRNNVSSGMCGLMIGLILAVIGFMFFALSHKATNGGVLDTTCVEFYVFVCLVVFGTVLIAYAITSLIVGKRKIFNYETLLKNINNEAFHQ